jgi:hypothetical protein
MFWADQPQFSEEFKGQVVQSSNRPSLRQEGIQSQTG